MEELFVGVVVLVVVLAPLSAWFFSPGAVARRRLRKASKIPLGSVADGQVATVVGRLRYDDEHAALRAPLTDRETENNATRNRFLFSVACS